MNSTITEMKILGGINSRLNEAEDQVSNLENNVAENTELEH